MTGQDPDSTFSLRVASTTVPMASLTAATVIPLPSGATTAVLTGIRHNCTEDHAGTVPFSGSGDTLAATFIVRCRAIAPVSVRIAIDPGSTPPSEFLDVYVDHDLCESVPCVVQVGSQPLELHVAAGERHVTLANLPQDCQVAGGPDAVIQASSTQVVDVLYQVRCDPGAVLGVTVRATIQASGSPRPTNYRIEFRPENDWGSVTSAQNGGSVTFADVAMGRGTVALPSLPSNCSAEGGSEHAYYAQLPASLDMTFKVSCH